MSATLREYRAGKHRARYWKRYDSAVRALLDFSQKFERDEQAQANELFRKRYGVFLTKLRDLIGGDHADLDSGVDSGDGVAADSSDGGRVTDLKLVPSPMPPQILGNEQVGTWTPYLAIRLPDDKGDVVVCLPDGLTLGETAKAWAAVARMAVTPGHPVQDAEYTAEESCIGTAGEFRVIHPDYPESAAREFIQGVNELTSVAREVHEVGLSQSMVATDWIALMGRLGAALKDFGK